MKIILINKFHYRRGGAETYYFDLGEVLTQHGHDVHYFSMKDEKNYASDDEKFFVNHQEYVDAKSPFDKLRALGKTVYSKEAKKKLEHLIENVQPDIIHVNNYHRQLSCSIFDAAKKYNVPIVMTAHDATNICPQIYMNYRESCTQCVGGRYYNCLKKRCIKNSFAMSLAGTIEGYISKIDRVYDKIDLLVVPSHYISEIYLADGFDLNKVTVLHNAKKINTVKPEKWPERNYAIYFGRLSKEKGIMTLLQAINKTNIIPIYIVGEGAEKENIEDYIIKHSLETRVKLLGYKTGEELERLIEGAKFAILPSETPENCPYGVIEAMACGVPVIGSDLGGTPELIDFGKNGWKFKAGDSDDLANKLIEANQHAAEMYENSYRKAKDEYSMQHYYTQIIDIYNKVIRRYEHK